MRAGWLGGLALAAMGALAPAGAGEVERVEIDTRILHLFTDFNANGLPESLRVRIERRSVGGQAPRTQVALDLLERLSPCARHGFVSGGLRYRHVPGGQFLLEGFTAHFSATQAAPLAGAAQVRRGMLGAVRIPLEREDPAVALVVVIYNTARGEFRLGVDALDFAEVAERETRELFLAMAREPPPGEPAPGALQARVARVER